MSRSRHRRPSRASRTRPTSKTDVDLVAVLEAGLGQERERRDAIEQQLREQAAQLEALRQEIASVRRGLPQTDDLPSRRNPDGSSHELRMVELPRESAETGPAYWLRRCEGFDVNVGGKPLGTVEGVRFSRRHDRPDMLIVTVGRRRSLLLVPVETIAEISPDDELVTLLADPRDPEPGAVQRDHALANLLARRLRRLHPDAP